MRRGEGGGPAINRCMQIPDRTARRGHAAFAGWCSSVAWSCSLRSELRSRGGSLAPCVMTKAGVHLTPRSTEPCSPAFDLRRNQRASQCAAGARLSSVLSLPLSSARARRLGLVMVISRLTAVLQYLVEQEPQVGMKCRVRPVHARTPCPSSPQWIGSTLLGLPPTSTACSCAEEPQPWTVPAPGAGQEPP
jgi:hypothetical protein